MTRQPGCVEMTFHYIENRQTKREVLACVARSLASVLHDADVPQTDRTNMPQAWGDDGWMIDSTTGRWFGDQSSNPLTGRSDLWAVHRRNGGALVRYTGVHCSPGGTVIEPASIASNLIIPPQLFIWDKELAKAHPNAATMSPERLYHTDAMAERIGGYVDRLENPDVTQAVLQTIESASVSV